jgi:hypothetical protein
MHHIASYVFHLSACDLVVILGELQRRTGFEVFLGVEDGGTEGYIEFRNRPLPPRAWFGNRPWVYYRLRFCPDVCISDFTFAALTLDFLNLNSKREHGRPWHPGPSASVQFEEAAEMACIRPRAAPGLGNPAEERDRMLVLRLMHGSSKGSDVGGQWRYKRYRWDVDSWRTFMKLAFARREAVWADSHVWPDALALYHVLTRRGLDGGCAASLMTELVVTPRVRAFRRKPKKKHIVEVGNRGFQIAVR